MTKTAGDAALSVHGFPRSETPPGRDSYFEFEIGPGIVNIYERMGDGVTDLLVESLRKLGLQLCVRVSSPCG